MVAECRLVVRLADPEMAERDPHINKVGFARGRAMITRYMTKNNVVVGAPPFHATLLAGTLAGSGAEHLAAEQFLRLAEPPAHDRWEFNEDLREKYSWGAGARIREMFDAVTEALQELLRTHASDEHETPEVLRRLIQIRPPGPPSAVRAKLHKVIGSIEDGAWKIRAEVSLNPLPQYLEVTPRLAFAREGGAGVPVRWTALNLVEGGVDVDGETFVVRPRAKRFSFEGTSDPSTHPVDASDGVVTLDLQTKVRKLRDE
jgi:hypothetical protein